MKLFINAGGKGERLYPLTKDIPKPMVEVNGKPVLHHYVDWAKGNGIKEIVMMNGYKAEKIVDYFKDGEKFGIPIKHSVEDYPLDSGGPIRLARNHVDGTFCYVNGDNICKVDLKKVTDFHKENNADLTIVLVEKEKGYGDFLKLDNENNVVELLRKDSENLDDKGLAHAGMCIIEPKILDLMDKEVFNFEHYVFPKAIEKGFKVKGYATNELIEDMGTVERLRAVENLLMKETKMRVLVTGAGGMMGTHLLDFLVNKGHDVLGLDFVPTTDIRELNSKAEYVECDIRDRNKLTNLMNRFKPEIIFHLAAQSYPTVSWDRPNYTIETNVLGTINLFEAIKELKLDPIVLNACTSGEYGYVEEKDIPIKETQELKPLHPYGVSKVAQEFLAYQYFKNFGIKSVSVRIFNTTGPKKVNDVCSDWTKQIVLMEKGLQDKIMTVGNLETRRAITDVRDLIEAFWLTVDKCDHGETYNLSGEKVYLMKDILEELKTLTDVKFEVRQDPKLMRPTDEPIIYGDSTKFKDKTDWSQKIELRQTLKDMLDYWREKV